MRYSQQPHNTQLTQSSASVWITLVEKSLSGVRVLNEAQFGSCTWLADYSFPRCFSVKFTGYRKKWHYCTFSSSSSIMYMLMATPPHYHQDDTSMTSWSSSVLPYLWCNCPKWWVCHLERHWPRACTNKRTFRRSFQDWPHLCCTVLFFNFTWFWSFYVIVEYHVNMGGATRAQKSPSSHVMVFQFCYGNHFCFFPAWTIFFPVCWYQLVAIGSDSRLTPASPGTSAPRHFNMFPGHFSHLVATSPLAGLHKTVLVCVWGRSRSRESYASSLIVQSLASTQRPVEEVLKYCPVWQPMAKLQSQAAQSFRIKSKTWLTLNLFPNAWRRS